jgi:hypothetical protein
MSRELLLLALGLCDRCLLIGMELCFLQCLCAGRCEQHQRIGVVGDGYVFFNVVFCCQIVLFAGGCLLFAAVQRFLLCQYPAAMY